MIEVRGRVVDPDGRPVAGATVQSAYLDREIKPAPESSSGPDGRFFMRVPSVAPQLRVRRRDAMFPWVVASAPGFGPGWASAVREPGASGEIDDPAGRGRPADRGPDRRPGGAAGRRRAGQGRARLVRQGGQTVGLAGAGRGRRRARARAGARPVAGGDHCHHRHRRAIPPCRDRPRPDRRV